MKALKRFFKRAHPYTVAYYLGRKNTQRILDCKIKKKSKLLAEQHQLVLEEKRLHCGAFLHFRESFIMIWTLPDTSWAPLTNEL